MNFFSAANDTDSQSNNLITNFNDQIQISNGFTDTDQDYVYVTATDAVDCCQQCDAAGDGCGGFSFFNDDSDTCVFYPTGDTPSCHPATSDAYLVADGGATFTSGNSNCGQFRFFS